jgi:hypothetical protein
MVGIEIEWVNPETHRIKTKRWRANSSACC